VEAVSGQLLGGAPEQLLLYVNGARTAVRVTGSSFETLVPLEPGFNRLRAVAVAPGGIESDDAITIDYTLPVSSTTITLTSPRDGVTLGLDEAPIVVVEGRVDDRTLDTVWLVVNGRRIRTSAREGQFRRVVPVSAPVLRIWAETPANGAPAHRSDVVTVHGAGSGKPMSVLVMDWPSGATGLNAEVSATWRPSPETLDETSQTIKFSPAEGPSRGGPPDVFYLRGLKPGVYTVTLRYHGPTPAGAAIPTLYLPDQQGLSPRRLPPVSLDGNGRAMLAKVLLPYGVFWDQDEWFSGRSESVDTITKFRLPEGVSWVERKGELR
jgi:hypothetical protein